MAAAELLYAQLTQQLRVRPPTFIFQKTVFCVRTALMLFLQALLLPPSSTRKDTNMKNMHKMPDGSMMKNSAMKKNMGGYASKIMSYGGKMAKGGEVTSCTPRGNGQARNKPCKIC
jgi:hypothetical protein